MYGWYNVWVDWFKLHNDLQNETHIRFNAHLHFSFNYVTRRGGGGIHHKHYKTLFVWTYRTVASWIPFLTVGGKLFLSSYALHAGAFCSVWNCTSSLSLFSIFHFLLTNFRRRPFCEKVVQESLHLIRTMNRLYDADKPLGKDMCRICPDLPIQKKPGYLEFCEMRVFRVVRLCCQHIF